MQESEDKIVTFNLCVTVWDSVIQKRQDKTTCSLRVCTVNYLDFWILLWTDDLVLIGAVVAVYSGAICGVIQYCKCQPSPVRARWRTFAQFVGSLSPKTVIELFYYTIKRIMGIINCSLFFSFQYRVCSWNYGIMKKK